MRTLLKLTLMLLVGVFISSQTIAAPQSQTDQQAQTTIIATADIAISPAIFSSSNTPDRDALPGIVITSKVNNSTDGTTAGSQYNQGAKKYLLNTQHSATTHVNFCQATG